MRCPGPKRAPEALSGRVLVHVTTAVARYSLLRKTVDQFSHGSTGWQGSVTDKHSAAQTQALPLRELASLGPRSRPISGGYNPMTGNRGLCSSRQAKWEQGFPPCPSPLSPTLTPQGGTLQVFGVLRKFFSFGLFFSGAC